MLLATPLVFALAAACGSDDSGSGSGSTGNESDGGGTGDGDTGSSTGMAPTGDGSSGAPSPDLPPDEPPLPPIGWSEQCTIAGSDLKELDPRLQCAAIEVPLDWSDPEGPAITIAAVRVPSTGATHRGQFWLLDGGPGGAGIGNLTDQPLIDQMVSEGWDVVIPAHRGTLSPRLDCQVPNTSSCREELDEAWGDGVVHFNSQAAARDVGHLIARTQEEFGEPTVVYGVSYGTHWAQHYLATHPDQADAVILDSVLVAGGGVLEQEPHQQGLVEDLLQRCLEEPTCAEKVALASGSDFAAAVTTAFDEGACGDADEGLWEESDLRFDLGGLLNRSTARNYVPVLTALLRQCTPESTALVEQALSVLRAADFIGQPRLRVESPTIGWGSRRPGFEVDPSLFFSDTLRYVVMGTSVMLDGEDPTEVNEASRRHLVTLGGFSRLFAEVHEYFADLPDVPLDSGVAVQTPVLVLNAAYDLQTPLPWAEVAASRLGAQLVVFDDLDHGVVYTGSGPAQSVGCARALMLSFMRDPSAPLDTSCALRIPGIDPLVQGPRFEQVSVEAFGTADPWTLVGSPVSDPS